MDGVADAPRKLPIPVDARSAALTVLAGIALVLILRYAQALVIPVVLSILISYALEPVVTRLTGFRVPRPLAAALVVLLLVTAGGALGYELRGQATALVDQLPDAARRLRRMIEGQNGTGSAIAQVQQAATELERAAKAAGVAAKPAGVQEIRIANPPFRVGPYLMWGSLGLAAAVAQVILILFLVYFLLASGDLYRRKLIKIAGPSLSKRRITLAILEEIDRQIARFLLVQACVSVLVAVATWLALRWVGVEQAALWGVLAGVFNSIPYFGPVIVTGSIAILAFLQFGQMEPALTAAGATFAITTAEGMLITPYLTSRAARMNAVAVFVGLLFWGWLWEVWGLLLAVPMLVVIKAVSDHVEDFRSVGEILGE